VKKYLKIKKKKMENSSFRTKPVLEKIGNAAFISFH